MTPDQRFEGIAGLAWAAGIYEGEGTIWFGGSKGPTRPDVCRVTLAIGMTDLDVLKRFHSIVGVGTITGPYVNGWKSHHKPLYRWQVGRLSDVAHVAGLIRPWLMERRARQMDDVLKRAREYAVRQYGDGDACGRGHRWDEGDNSYVNVHGYKVCRVCRREADARRRPRKRGHTENDRIHT